MWEILQQQRPYPNMSNFEVIESIVRNGYRLPKPTNQPDGSNNQLMSDIYAMMLKCWNADPQARPTFTDILNFMDSCIEQLLPSTDNPNTDQSQDYVHTPNNSNTYHKHQGYVSNDSVSVTTYQDYVHTPHNSTRRVNNNVNMYM